MSTRISKRSQYFVAVLSLPLASCGQEQPGASETAQRRDDGQAAMHIPCAKGDAALAANCTIEQAAGPDGIVLTIRHPGGGFRRLRVTADGRGVVAADGAEQARVTVPGAGNIDVALGTERYRLPATVRAGATGS
jgi:glucose/arabinose dehydrogenase